jgi:two-component system, LuxR family, sensor histidine kinase TtrS
MQKIITSIFILLALTASLHSKQLVNIGVLAHKNYETTEATWLPTAEYLKEKIPEYDFHIQPLRFDEFPPYLRDKKIDFVITNSAYYVDLENRYGISRIATLKNIDFKGKAQTEFGGVIITKASNTSIKRLEDLRGKSFAAVDKESFGGWIMALRELKESGITEKELKTTFYGTHEAVVLAVRDSKAQAGTIRSDALERMASEGKINLNDFTIINQKNYSNFFYLASTRLYPEWPFAKTKHIQDELAEKVAVALISMPENSKAAKASKSMGWTIPLDYQSIHECLKELELGPYEYLKKAALSYFIEKYWSYILVASVLLILSIIASLYIAGVNNRLRETRKELREANESLEERVEQKTQHLYEKSTELEKAYLNEKYLRSILRTVADINQMLITTHSLDELLDRATLCLSSNESLMSAKICVLKNGKLVVAASYGTGDEKIVTEIEQKAFNEGMSLMITNFDDSVPEHCRKKAEIYGIKAVYVLPLKSSSFTNTAIGVLTICSAMEGGFSVEEQDMIEELCGDIGFAINSFTQKEQIDTLHEEKLKSYQDFIGALVNMIEQRDTYTAGHTERVAKYAEIIAKEMGLSGGEIKKLVEAAKLHDIGKVVTPDSVLLKPSALSKLEYELIKDHVSAGCEVLSTVHFYKELANIVADHHERYDGSGYPNGKKSSEIPILGHILAVADSFDAMTTNRIYKPRKEVDESLKELKELSGTWYHPAVVDAAVKSLANIEVDTSINQLGTTLIDEERLSYFFKDRLTKLYNEDYFTLTINGRSRHKKPHKLLIISLLNFTKYNKEHTWEGGNELLAEFASFLSKNLPEHLIFRIWGDRFAIADFDEDIRELLSRSVLASKNISYKVKQITQLPQNPKELLNDI